MLNKQPIGYESLKRTTVFAIICAAILHSSMCFSHSNEYELLEEKVVTSPYISEMAMLNEPFELYIAEGASVSLDDKDQWLKITLNKMTILCVQVEGDCLGNQFSFNFTAGLDDKQQTFNLVVNEPHNMDLIELDIEKSDEQLFSSYTIALLDLNFAINKNSISLVVSK